MNQEIICPERALAALLEVRQKVWEEFIVFLQMGICSCFSDTYIMKRCDYSLSDYMRQAGIDWSNWPKYSGSRIHPVPYKNSDGDYVNPTTIYNITTNYWVGDYGNDRKELLNWLIEQFETVIKNKEPIK